MYTDTRLNSPSTDPISLVSGRVATRTPFFKSVHDLSSESGDQSQSLPLSTWVPYHKAKGAIASLVTPLGKYTIELSGLRIF